MLGRVHRGLTVPQLLNRRPAHISAQHVGNIRTVARDIHHRQDRELAHPRFVQPVGYRDGREVSAALRRHAFVLDGCGLVELDARLAREAFLEEVGQSGPGAEEGDRELFGVLLFPPERVEVAVNGVLGTWNQKRSR